MTFYLVINLILMSQLHRVNACLDVFHISHIRWDRALLYAEVGETSRAITQFQQV